MLHIYIYMLLKFHFCILRFSFEGGPRRGNFLLLNLPENPEKAIAMNEMLISCGLGIYCGSGFWGAFL